MDWSSSDASARPSSGFYKSKRLTRDLPDHPHFASQIEFAPHPLPMPRSSSVGAPLPLAFCGSKAGATFRCAMIPIGSGLKPRASQRCRNNCLTLELENWALPDFLGGEPRPPHHVASGGGGCRAISRPQTELQCASVGYCVAKMRQGFCVKHRRFCVRVRAAGNAI